MTIEWRYTSVNWRKNVLSEINTRIFKFNILSGKGFTHIPRTHWQHTACDSSKPVTSLGLCRFRDFSQNQRGCGGGALACLRSAQHVFSSAWLCKKSTRWKERDYEICLPNLKLSSDFSACIRKERPRRMFVLSWESSPREDALCLTCTDQRCAWAFSLRGSSQLALFTWVFFLS